MTEKIEVESNGSADVEEVDPGKHTAFIDKDTLVWIVKETIEKAGEIDSLRKFTELVNARIERESYNIKTSPQRIKNLVIKYNLAEVTVKVRRGNRHGFSDICPVCSNKMVNERNATIYGWKITSKKRCIECEFWTDRNKTSIARYIFHSKKS